MVKNFLIAFVGLMAVPVPLLSPSIVGHWLAGGPDNAQVWVDFNGDGSFKVYTAAATENQGRYAMNADTISLYDNNCGLSVAGRYLLKFYGEDSVSFSLLADPCKDRSGEVNGGRMKRLR
ncbi:MAG TPA: hypothetical protein VGM89_13340 [Puia sp.]|jgi:hypothetical protein